MKGIVFTEFFELVEDNFGYEMVDKIIINTDLPSQGVYTAVGTYSHTEIVILLMELSKLSKISPGELLRLFGHKLFDTFKTSYGMFFEKPANSFELLTSVEEYIHVEVKKLYPDATLPAFDTEMINDKSLRMVYKSERSMSMLAKGLIEKTLEHYKEEGEIKMTPLDEDGSVVEFIITLS